MDSQQSLKELWEQAPVARRVGAIAVGLMVLFGGILAVNISWF